MTLHFISGETTDSLSLQDLSNELAMIQSGSKRIAIIGTRNLSITHGQLVETLSYALSLARNTVYTSGGSSGVNAAVIRGALKAGDDNLLEVLLPQTREQQTEDMQELLKAVPNIREHPERIHMDFPEASELCYKEIIDSTHQLICFLYHDSKTLQATIDYAKNAHKITTIFYLD